MKDNKCLWKLETHWFVGYDTGCNEATDGEPRDWSGDQTEIIGMDYTYCPYCGLEIEWDQRTIYSHDTIDYTGINIEQRRQQNGYSN